jgi:hypothetical protein
MSHSTAIKPTTIGALGLFISLGAASARPPGGIGIKVQRYNTL